MASSHKCPYCLGSYASTGGLTRHYNHCPERKADLRIQEAAASAPHVTNVSITQQNVTIIQITQQLITSEIPLFDTFLGRLLTSIGSEAAAWREGSDAARAKLREIKAAFAQSSDENDKAIGYWLASESVEREVDESLQAAGADEIIQHTTAQVNRIEETAFEVIKRYMSEDEQARFTAAFKEAGSLFAL